MSQFDHPLTYRAYENQGMGGFFSDIKDVFVGIIYPPALIQPDPVKELASEVAKALKQGVVSKIDSINDLRELYAQYLDKSLTYQFDLFSQLPVKELQKVSEEFDKFTGGTLSEVRITITIPGALVRGEKLTPEQIYTGLSVGLKVGAIAISGGSAAAIIAATASQLKKGTLGKDKTGRDILTVAELAGFAVAAKQTISDAAIDYGKKKVWSEVEKQAIEKTSLGKSYLGRTLVSAGGGVFSDGEKGLVNFATKEAKTQAVQRLPKGKYIVKYGPYLYEGLIAKDFDVAVPSLDEMIGKAQTEIAKIANEAPDKLQNAVERAASAKLSNELSKQQNILFEKIFGRPSKNTVADAYEEWVLTMRYGKQPLSSFVMGSIGVVGALTAFSLMRRR